MRMLTKADVCRELGLSLSTGELQAKREPRGRRHRVYVMLDDDPPRSESNLESGNTALAVARERIRGLEEQVALLQEPLEREQQRNADQVNELKVAQDRRSLAVVPAEVGRRYQVRNHQGMDVGLRFIRTVGAKTP